MSAVLARLGSQRRMPTAQCDKSKDLYLACFYDDCSQIFPRFWARSEKEMKLCALTVRVCHRQV